MNITAYSLTIPTIDEDTAHFNFNASVEALSFNFDFWFYAGSWHLFVSLPDESVREAAIYPNAQNWSGYTDYRLVASTVLDTIGQANLQDVLFQLAVIS
jgi:hypothetical protein